MQRKEEIMQQKEEIQVSHHTKYVNLRSEVFQIQRK